MILRKLLQRAGREFLSALPRSLVREGVVFEQHIREGRFQRSLALVAGASSVLGGLEVAYEHYRGSYGNRMMYTPVLLSSALVGAGLWAAFSPWAARTVLPAVSLLTLADGVTGFIYHVRGIARKPGGWRLPVDNIVMGPPIFAPLLFCMPAYIGLVAAFLRREDDPRDRFLPRPFRPRPAWLRLLPRRLGRRGFALEHEIREGRFQKHVAAAAAVGAFFSGVEALYSHYKSGFKHKMQWTPVVLAPALMGAGIGAVHSRGIARTALPVASVLAIADGAVGFYYHARGVLRRPGGMKLPLYNIMYGPPVFAPLLLAACGTLGLLASLLRRER